MATLQDLEVMLCEAIATGNFPCLKRLVNSGIGCNAVLHSPLHWESTTVLSTAAYAGNIQMVKYLVETGASVNLQDPGLRRNALHWASMGPSTTIVKYLLKQGADINALDRDNMSPLLQAAVHRHQSAVQALVLAGADVHQVDRLRCSALHYAAFHGDPIAVAALVEAGCIHNNSIFGKGTPLANLISHGDLQNIQLLLAAGYQLLTTDLEIVSELSEDCPIKYLVKNHFSQAASLKHHCRVFIRSCVKGANLHKSLKELPLPPCLIRYLLLEPLMENENSIKEEVGITLNG